METKFSPNFNESGIKPYGKTVETVNGQKVETVREKYRNGTRTETSIFEFNYVTGKDEKVSKEIVYDYDGDGKADEVFTAKYYKGINGQCAKTDKGADGTTDRYGERITTEQNGVKIELLKWDNDADGKVDKIEVFEAKTDENGKKTSTHKIYTPEEYEKETGKSAQFSKDFGI